MGMIRAVARPMLASIFVVQGFNKLRAPDSFTAQAKPVTDRVAPLLERYAPRVPTDQRTLVRISGAIDLTAGAMLATSRLPRFASFVLTGSLVPGTIAGHPYWQVEDRTEKAKERVQFLKNVGLVGGLLLAGVDTEGRPGLRWRTQHAAKDTRKAARAAAREARLTARAARAEAAGKARNVLHR
ncbi:MAG TPA: DoxX family protein [Jiangellaceae bacterium]|nr:DoxX family protein [Jiangellaceae bacterium]